MTITKLGVYRMRGGGEARVAAMHRWGTVVYGYKKDEYGNWVRCTWKVEGGEYTAGVTAFKHEELGLVELIQEWPEGK